MYHTVAEFEKNKSRYRYHTMSLKTRIHFIFMRRTENAIYPRTQTASAVTNESSPPNHPPTDQVFYGYHLTCILSLEAKNGWKTLIFHTAENVQKQARLFCLFLAEFAQLDPDSIDCCPTDAHDSPSGPRTTSVPLSSPSCSGRW